MDDVIEALRREAARHQEWVKAQYVMIEILEEAVSRLHVAGFSPQLVRDDSGLSLVLDPDRWTVPAAGPADVFDPEEFSTAWRAVAAALKDKAAAGFMSWREALVPGAVSEQAAVLSASPIPSPEPQAPAAPSRGQQMLDLRAEGVPDREIAARLGVTLRAVQKAFTKLRAKGVAVPPPPKVTRRVARAAERAGVPVKGWSAEEEAQLADLYAQGQSLAEIAAQMGRSANGLSVQLTRLRAAGKVGARRHVSPHDGKWPDERLAELRRRWITESPKAIAASMGLTRGAVSGMASRLGLGPSQQGKAVAEQKSDKDSATAAVPKIMPPKPVPAATPKPLPEAAAPSGFVGQKGGALTAPGSRPMAFVRPVGQVLVGMTQAEKEAAMAAHVAGLPLVAGWDADLDLELCEAVFGGAKVGVFAAYAELDPKDCLARFDMIVAPLRLPGHKHLPIEAGPLVLGALRKRVALARAGGVAA